MSDTREVVDGRIQWREETSGDVWRYDTTILSPDAQQALGLVAHWAAWLEVSLELALIDLLVAPSRHRAVKELTRDLSASQLIGKARAVLKHSSRDTSDALRALDAAKRALEHRNSLLHGAMGGHLTDRMVSILSRRREAQTEASLEDFQRVAEELFDAHLTVSSMRWRTWAG